MPLEKVKYPQNSELLKLQILMSAGLDRSFGRSVGRSVGRSIRPSVRPSVSQSVSQSLRVRHEDISLKYGSHPTHKMH